MKALKTIYLAAILPLFLLVSCDKEGDMVIKPVKAYKEVDISGFVFGDTIEQYFDGVKARDYFGEIKAGGVGNEIAFINDQVIMELKNKRSGETIYKQIFNVKDATIEVPKFYYDGDKFYKTFPHPEGEAGVEKINFYFDVPLDMPMDIAYGDGSNINNVKYLARNVQPGRWTEFLNVPPLDGRNLFVFLLKPGKLEYLNNNDINFSFMQHVNLPTTGGYQGGGVQSWYVRFSKRPTGVDFLSSEVDFVQMFPQ